MKLVYYRKNPDYSAIIGRRIHSERTTPCWSCGALIRAGVNCHLAEKTRVEGIQDHKVKVCLICAATAKELTATASPA